MTAPVAPRPVETLASPGTIPQDLAADDAPRRTRLESVDILRGLVMVIMMIDHTRDFVNAQNYQFDATDVTRTTVPLFFTRWITHFCAPLFVFLSGVSIHLQKARGRSDLSSFLLKRGLWLVVIEVTLLKLLVWFTFAGTFAFLLQVIWVIGIGMIVMAGLVRLPAWVSAAVGLSMITLHNLTDGLRVPGWTGPASVVSIPDKLWILLHQGGPLPVAASDGPVGIVLYSLIPWVGVMAAGYAFGRVYDMEAERRRRVLVQIGAGCVAIFLALRLSNAYGDPSLWSVQPAAAMTVVSFFNVTKYPASLLFLLMTIGPGLLALAAFERWDDESRVKAFFVTFGRVPLFYYMLQWIWAHGAAVVLSAVSGKSIGYLFFGFPDMFSNAPPNAGFSLGVTWLVWLVGVFALYPLCRWYAGVKARRGDWWISYT